MSYEIQLRPHKKRRWPLVLLAFVVIALATGFAYVAYQHYLGRSPFDQSLITSHQSLLYHCPMHPTYTSDKPGTCPICGMDLVPAEQHDAGGSTMREHDHEMDEPPGRAAIRVTDTQRHIIGVTTTKAAVMPLTKEIRTVGTVAFDPDLAVAQQEYLSARRLGDASLAAAAEQRLQLMGMSADQIKEIARIGRIQKNLYLIAPDGSAWIYASMYESDIFFIKVGQMMEVRIPHDEGSALGGTITAIDPVIDDMTRTMRVRAEVRDPARVLKPNQYVDVYLKVPLGEALTVPRSAVLWSEKASYVFVDEGDGMLAPRKVVVGGQNDDQAQILEGLVPGDNVVTRANFLIDAESQLKATLKEMGNVQRQEDHGGHAQ